MMFLRLLFCLAAAHTAHSAYNHTIMLLQYNTSTHDTAFEAAIIKSMDSIYTKINVTVDGAEVETTKANVNGTICVIPTSSTNPRTTVNAVCKCLANTKVSGIVGPYTSDQSLIVAYLTATLKIPTITPSASAGILLDKGEWTDTLFKLTPNNKQQAIAIADLLVTLQFTRAAIIYTTDVYGMSLALYMMQECKARDIKIATSIVLKTTDTEEQIGKVLEKDLVPFEARLVLLLVPGSETDAIVTKAYELDLINSETVWVTGDGPAHFIETHDLDDYDAGMYKGMISVTQYVDIESQDMLDLHEMYEEDHMVDEHGHHMEMSPESSGVYYSTILLAKALENISTPPVDTGCEAEWSNGGDEARSTLMDTYYDSLMPDKTTGYNISFGAANTIKESRFEVMNHNGTAHLTKVGEWDDTVSLKKNKITWFGKTQPDATATSIRAKLRLGINRDEPFVFYKKDLKPDSDCQGNDCYNGFALSVVEELSKRLTFDYELVESNDGKFGGMTKNGTWNGLVKMLMDKEIQAATVGFGTSSTREGVIDFSANIRDGGVYFMAKMQEQEDAKLFFMRPFSYSLWFGLLIISVVVMILVWVLDAASVSAKKVRDERKEKKEEDPQYDEDDEGEDPHISIAETVFTVLATFLGQGGDNPRCWPSRIVMTGWWFIMLVMINTYIADLAAALTVQRMADGYSSISEIMKDKSIKWGTVDDSVTKLLLENSMDPDQRELISRADNVKTYNEGVARVQKGKYLMMYGMGPLHYSSNQQPCNMEVLSKIPLAMFGYAFAFPQNSPYRDTLNKELLKLGEDGFMTKTWDDWTNSECEGAEEPSIAEDADEENINLTHLYDLMVVFVPLLIIAAVLFIFEWVAFLCKSKCKRAISPDLPNGITKNGRAKREKSR
uniref:Ionotropic glutamate receptor n=1 Tax=Euplokamis dunlapae TaxID=1403701 RepID=A0A1S6WN61_9METZ|nr:ionotropic glutamate receptor [Euplokamis dunlapae]